MYYIIFLAARKEFCYNICEQIVRSAGGTAMNGKFIVIEGLDGSGKSTQFERLKSVLFVKIACKFVGKDNAAGYCIISILVTDFVNAVLKSFLSFLE